MKRSACREVSRRSSVALGAVAAAAAYWDAPGRAHMDATHPAMVTARGLVIGISARSTVFRKATVSIIARSMQALAALFSSTSSWSKRRSARIAISQPITDNHKPSERCFTVTVLQGKEGQRRRNCARRQPYPFCFPDLA